MESKPPFFRFPRWTNTIRGPATIALVAGPIYIVLLLYYGFAPRTRDVGYSPKQPVPYSHALHAGQLGIDCRYCHNTVEVAARAAIPPTHTCMNCHASVRTTSEKLIPVRESFASGNPVEWVRVHDLPDFVYFNHSAHVRKGVGCVTCHGRVDKMEEVYQVNTLSMAWCLHCHRNPDKNLRPLDQITSMDWVPSEDPETLGKRLAQENDVRPQTSCFTCHR
jgi:hypothetical protein